MTKEYKKGLEEYQKMISSDKQDVEKRKGMLEKLPEADLERALTQLVYLEDLYDDVKSYLHKLNRSLSKGYVSLYVTPQYLNMIENNLKTIDMLLEGLRNSDDYRALKQILKARGERI